MTGFESLDSHALNDIATERVRQISSEGWTPEHDDSHDCGEMAIAAAAYAMNSSANHGGKTFIWPWDSKYWKPTTSRRDLVKAGALIVAEIERLDRAAARPAK